MSEEAHQSDAELDGLLAAVADGGPEMSAAEMDAMFGAVEERVSRADGNPIHWLRSRSTTVRRALALGSFAVIFGVVAASMPAEDWAQLMAADIVVALAALGVLLTATLTVAVRPLHVPALPRGRVLGLAAASVLATFVLAVTVGGASIDGHEHTGSFWAQATPCMYFGFLIGVPVYAVARLVDRGAYLGSLLAAAAAGLAGNFMLQMRCPISDPMHNLAGHASVALVFVGAILLFESIFRRRRL